LQLNDHGTKKVVAETFFNLLDVGTSNALVLHNMYLKSKSEDTGKYKPMNILQFKMKLVDNFVGQDIDSLFESGGCAEDQHVPAHITDKVRSLCVWCALMSRSRRTRYQCAKCGIPLCSIGNGRVEEDCFTAARETGDRLEMVQRKNVEMKKRVRNTKKKK
jgi:hypothetical protein